MSTSQPLRSSTDIDLSMIVCTYNRASQLAETLNALTHQRVRAGVRFEVVVVDNNSTDGTRAVVEAAARAATIGIRYTFEPAQGLSHARNHGIAFSRGTILAFTDDDVTPDVDWALHIVDSMDRWQADGVGGRILPRWSTPPPRWLVADPDLTGALALMTSENALMLTLDTPGDRVAVWGANMAFRRSLFEQIGGFDPSLGLQGKKLYLGEDIDLVRRALHADKRVVYDPAPVVWHRIEPERMRRRYFRQRAIQSGEREGLNAEIAGARTILGIPAYLLRLAWRQFRRWLVAAIARDSRAFWLELRMLETIGFVKGCYLGRGVNGQSSRQPAVESPGAGSHIAASRESRP